MNHHPKANEVAENLKAKLSRYFGRILSEECGIESRRGDAALEAQWDEKRKAYEADRDAQYAALAETDGQP